VDKPASRIAFRRTAAAIFGGGIVLPGQDGRFRLRSGRLSPAFILSASSH